MAIMYDTILQQIQDSRDCLATDNARYHKTGPGQYAEHERFYGIRAGTLRRIAATTYAQTTFDDLTRLLASPYNEFRLIATIILVMQYRASKQLERHQVIYRYYLKNLPRINNWNLIDNSAHWIVGAHLWQQDQSMLFDLIQSASQWPRRVAIVSTFYFIKRGQLDTTFSLAEALLNDGEDLMHKAVGWMLRETGKISSVRLRNFLYSYYAKLPRTTLRYAIEHFLPQERKTWLKGPQAL